MQLDSKEVSERIKNFIDARTIKISGTKYLPVDDNTVRRLMIELSVPAEEYYDVDDFRSRA